MAEDIPPVAGGHGPRLPRCYGVGSAAEAVAGWKSLGRYPVDIVDI